MMERIVNEDMSWLSDADQSKILVPLMLMRRHEVEYRLTREESANSLFKDNRAAFEKAFAGIVAAAVMKQQLTDQVKNYADAFTDWIASSAKITRSIAVISAETRQMLPAADEIVSTANRKTEAAAAGVAASQQQHQAVDRWHRHCGRLSRPLPQLVHRPQHREPAAAAFRRHEKARRGRQQRRHPLDRGQGRDRRHGAHGHRVPRQRDRARAARGDAGEIRARAGAARRDDCGDDLGLRGHGRPGAGEGTRRGRAARDCVIGPQYARPTPCPRRQARRKSASARPR